MTLKGMAGDMRSSSTSFQPSSRRAAFRAAHSGQSAVSSDTHLRSRKRPSRKETVSPTCVCEGQRRGGFKGVHAAAAAGGSVLLGFFCAGRACLLASCSGSWGGPCEVSRAMVTARTHLHGAAAWCQVRGGQ